MADRFKSERDLIRNKLRGIFNHRYRHLCDLEIEGWRTKEPVSFSERTSGEYIKIKVGDSWGEHWDCVWFHITGKVPQEAKGRNVIARIDFSGEGCVFSSEGTPLQGLTLERRHRAGEMLGADEKSIINITECSQGNEEIDIWIDAGCNSLFGEYIDNGKFKMASISILNNEMNQLYYDFHVLKSLMKNLPEDNAQRHSIFNTLQKACYKLKQYTEDEAAEVRTILKKELDKKGGDPSLKFTAIGHAHLDLAWLWPIRESKRKAARTFATALRHMEKYPGYCFGQSQPQQYKWIKEEHPALYSEIKKRIDEGRLEPQGGMWVEADTNVAGGEALIRQLLYGKRFFMKEFGKDIRVLWLPDVFGYSGALPQILKKSGVDYFMTIKLSWSKINDFPYHTFNWQGIDGSKVLSHMPPEGSYGSWADPGNVVFAEKNFHEKGLSDEALILYGVSDGGGGPGEDHLETITRIENLNGLSPVHQEPAVNFFERVGKYKDELPTWRGELYLEYHQGTYTTQARNKLYNRKMELSLREAEFASIMAFLLCHNKENGNSFEYPQERLDEIWEEVLLYQFHDILPGSSIKRVYDESVTRYMEMHEEVLSMINSAYKSIASNLIKNSNNKDIAVFNSLSWEREEWINTVTGWLKINIPAAGYTLLGVGEAMETDNTDVFCKLHSDNGVLENDKIKVTFNDAGQIISILDKAANREAVDNNASFEGQGANRMTVYNDPGDAWDFSLQYRNEVLGEFMLENAVYRVEGPNAIADFTFTYGDSFMTQNIVLTAGSPLVTVNCFVDWQESGKMLRAEIPVNVFSEDVRCNIQFGNVLRPTHSSSSWDYAKYEICAQKWIDISNRSYGVAILNDSKYGYGVFDNNISINLLRSPGHPGVDADKGMQVFSYAIYPHNGDYLDAQVDRKAYEFNIKPAVIQLDNSSSHPSFSLKNAESYFELTSGSGSVMIEAVKKAEDSSDVIVRLYEYAGAETSAGLEVNDEMTVKKAWVTDLMENELCELPVVNNTIEISFGIFEIHSIKLKL